MPPTEPAAAPSELEAQASTLPIAAEERELYDFVMQLVRGPAGQVGLAADAKLVMKGSRSTRRALKDAHADLGWIATSEIQLVSNQAKVDELPPSAMQCTPTKLTCLISEPGGYTTLTFRRQKGQLLLTRSESTD